MVNYSPELHTPASLDEEIQRVFKRSPNSLLVGSLGRAAALSRLGHSSEVEFADRGQEILFYRDRARDIDLITGENTAGIVDVPYELDTGVFNDSGVRLLRDGADWHLISDRKKFSEQLHPAVMEPIEAETVFGIPCKTVPVRTHLALFGLKGLMGPKVVRSRNLLMHLGGITEADLPEELYEPFTRLKELDKQGVYPVLQRAYHGLFPETMREKLLPITRPLKSLVP